MNIAIHKPVLLLLLLVSCLSKPVWAVTIQVTTLGEHTWDSSDTRAGGYVDFHGDNQLVSGRTPTEDALIAERLSFTAAPANSPMGNGALRLSTPGNNDKATIDKRDTPFPFFSSDITFEYSWTKARETVTTTAAPALKLGINTSEANASDNLALDRGEDSFDKILVYEPYYNHTPLEDTWSTEIITETLGLFWLVNLNTTSVLPASDDSNLKTLDQWFTEFSIAGLVGSDISTFQLGIGAFNPGQVSYVDYLSYSRLGENQTWDFAVATVPVPSAIWLFGSGLLGLIGFARRN